MCLLISGMLKSIVQSSIYGGENQKKQGERISGVYYTPY